MNKIDMRSDTVTLPTREMLDSIATAKLGDDVTGDDPTVNELQALAARMFGAEDALLVTSGTQGNLVAVLSHTRSGDEMIAEAESHIYFYEAGGISAVGGVIPRLMQGCRGVFNAEQVRETARGSDLHFPPSTLLAIENTHNRAGGTCWTPAQVAEVSAAAHDLGMKVHIDGARIFNAAVALDVPVTEYMKHVDSIQFCLSKGLCCPVGSIVVGEAAFIETARRKRKMLGGGMRQAGVIAAPGIVALNKMVSRLKEDHINAQRLARAISSLDMLRIDLPSVQTNIVVVDITRTAMTPEGFETMASKKGLEVSTFGPGLIRLVTHHGISEEDVDRAVSVVEDIVLGCPGGHCRL
jgi:threonine aldolase